MIVTLLTDYGRDDDFVGVCHGVMRGIEPELRIIDITHGISRYAVRQGAIVLRNTLPFMPVGVHVAVVDPQVGTERRAVALRTGDGRTLVGPDNGLLSLAWERCGGVEQAVDVTRSPHRLEPVSATFHGRDIFAPVAAHLAAGAELADAGDPLDPGSLATVELPQPRVEDGALVAHALVFDRFGNVGLNIDPRTARRHRHQAREHRRDRDRRRALPRQVRADLRGRHARRAARLRGRLPHARRGHQPRRRRLDARAAAGRRGLAAAAMIGTPRVHLRLTDSTNERAKELAIGGAPHGTLVTADEQTAGRGRQGRVWTAPPRSALLMSLVTRRMAPTLPLATAVAICDALPAGCEIKWPNDIWLGRRKLAGILVEGRPQDGWAVVGIGLNVTTEAFPEELADTATSLRIAGIELDTESVLAALLASLDEWLEAPAAEVMSAWSERDALRGERIRWTDGEGVAAGIDASGSLVVQTDNGRVALDAGEVHLLR